MLYLHSLQEAEETFKALSTPMRLRIMELIYENNNLSLNDLAEALGLTNSAISLHVGKLEGAGLVTIKTTSGKRGIRKVVQPVHDKLIVDLAPQAPANHATKMRFLSVTIPALMHIQPAVLLLRKALSAN